METSQPPARQRWRPTKLGIILLGSRDSGKASLGNLILGKEEFSPRESTSCSRRVALVGRCFLTVVNSPGWWSDSSTQDTPALVKTEIITSVSQCSPGPHVFLIAVKSSSAFTEKHRRALEEHVALLGQRVWGHCMVVCTSQHTPPEHPGGADSEVLRSLAERCGLRCCTVGEGGLSGGELLEKIQELVEGNGWSELEMDQEVLLKAMKEKSLVEERARQRFQWMRRYRALLRGRLRPVTHIQLVLLGAKGCGKTSSLHTILRRGHPAAPSRTTESQAWSGLVFGRQLTVVDTPGWWENSCREESSIFDRREMLLSLSLCPPGPHVFLLLVRVDRAFTDTHLQAAQQHLHMFGTNIWRRVIVVLTFGDWLGGGGAERCIESEGESLRRLVDDCGQRYHVLDNRAAGNHVQVRELIGRIEETLASCEGGGGHYEAERTAMEQIERRKREEQERAKERKRKEEERRRRAKSQLEELPPLTDIRIILTGGRKTGKSSCGDTILGREIFSLDPETNCCRQAQEAVYGKTVTVVDTPGCFPVTPDLLPPLTALLLVVNVSASFSDAQQEALERQLEACGAAAWSRTMVLFSHGDLLGGASVEQRVESEGQSLHRLLERCGNRYHVLDNQGPSSGGGAQVKELLELLEEMLVDERLEELRRGQSLWGGVSTAAGQQVVRLREKNVKRLRSCRCHLVYDTSPAASPAAQPSLSCCPCTGQMVALQAGRGPGRPGLTVVGGDLSSLSSVLQGKQSLRWTLNLPVSWISVHDLHLRLSRDVPASWSTPRPPAADLLALPPPSVSTLLQPALRGRTLQRLSQTGGLQLLLDRWDGSSLEELEAFIDSYFEKVWEETMESGSMAARELDSWKPLEAEQKDEEAEEEVLSSINRKLSKLELLEEIRTELTELRTNLEQSSSKERKGRMEKDENTDRDAED